jgi:predicted methyltransferase
VTRISTLLALGLGLALVSCVTGKPPSYITSSVSDAGRPKADTDRDAERKPGKMLAFAEIAPGQKVVDFLPGGGYFTRLFAKAVGPTGKVYAFLPNEYVALLKKPSPVQAIAGAPGYENVSMVETPVNEFAAPESVDLVWTSQNYHDLHDPFFAPADLAQINKQIFKALKPGGLYIVLDHSAEKGSGLRDTNTFHRIDEAAVRAEVEAAGFQLIGESDALRNPKDPRNIKVFDPSIRGHTDQFILKFRKPR